MSLAAEMLRLGPVHAGFNLEELAACIEACFDCVQACTACPMTSAVRRCEGDLHEYHR